MRGLGLGAYRFSIAWPRVVPGGSGAVNAAGLDFYDRLVDELLAAGIAPWATLYHWDLPQPLERHGRLARPRHRRALRRVRAARRTSALGDRVAAWLTLNEPWCAAFLGYATDVHAPGRVRSRRGSLAAAHHLLLAHGQALAALRAAGAGTIGAAVNLVPVAAGQRRRARRRRRAAHRRAAEPAVPRHAAARHVPGRRRGRRGAVSDLGHVLAGDLAQIAAPLDVLGINYYYTWAVAGDGEPGERPTEWVGSPHVRFVEQPLPTTDMGWFVEPSGLRATLASRARAGAGPAARDHRVRGGLPAVARRTRDRLAYLDAHLRECHRAIAEGVDLRGFMTWSLLDNFEWGWGYGKRFGVVDVDYETQRRTPRASARWYGDVARANALPGVVSP